MKMDAHLRAFFERAGKRGGKKRAANMTKDERVDAARRAANARWSKAREAKAS